MFTGLVQRTGRLAARSTSQDGARLTIDCGPGFLDDTAVGASIAVNGVCLTVTAIDGRSFTADVSGVTLATTTLDGLAVDTVVNLEHPVTPATLLGGHMVSGHVDGVGHVEELTAVGESSRMRVSVPDGLARYIARKGSVCVDGISLTVNEVAGTNFTVNIVPHTLAVTNLGSLAAGAPVNIEVDLVARYVERLLEERD